MSNVTPPDFVKEAASRQEREAKREQRAKQRSLSRNPSTSSKSGNNVSKATKRSIGGEMCRSAEPSKREGGEGAEALDSKKGGEGSQTLDSKKEGEGSQTLDSKKEGEEDQTLDVKKEGEGSQTLDSKKEGEGSQTLDSKKGGEGGEPLDSKKGGGDVKKGVERPRRYPKRNIPEKNYYENPEPDDDEYIYCEHCQKDVLGTCPDHGKPFRVLDSKVPSHCKDRASRSLPGGLRITSSSIPGAGLGVFTDRPIPKHTELGPYVGVLINKGNNDGYCWQIRRTGKSSLSVDAQDERVSNWLRFVDCARFDYEQNLMPYQYRGKIYYKTRRLILPGEELLVWYGKQFMTDLGINMKTYFDPPPPPPAATTQLIVKKGPGSALLCPWCKLSFSAQIFVQRHVASKHGWLLGQMVLQRTATVVLPPSVTATTLGACFSPGEVCDSLLAKLPAGGNSGALVKKNSEGRFPCHQCDKSYIEKGSLTVHLRTHTNDRPFKCSLCQYSSSQKSNLDTHMKTHTGEKNHECQTCGKKFSLKGNLNNHERSHTGEKPYCCTECDYKCTQSGHLTSHMRSHSGEKPYCCTECEFKCADSGSLTKHLRVHSGEKPYCCSICDYKCTESGTLTKHMRIHSGEKPFSCTECDYKSADSSSLTRHMKTHSGEKPFACTECDYKCTQSGTLTFHMRSHTGERPFSCSFCQQKFSQSSNLKQHIRRLHRNN